MNENQIADIWILIKEYIDKKSLEPLAERYIDLLADHGVSDKVFRDALGVDDTLDDAIEYYLDQGNEDSYDDEEEDWDLPEDDD